ncbi:MAG: nucleotidyl transferase AbiEii/AbiGii toxin family protein, partial [Ignavibacteria bacterium]
LDTNKNLFDLLKELSAADVKYVICGGVACVLHGVERATFDIDLSVSFEKSNLEKILLVARKFGLKPRIPEPVENLLDEIKRKEWYEKKNALVYTFVSDNSPLQLDIFLQYPMSFEELTENSKLIIIDNVSMNVSSPEDLLFVKKLINPLRDKDITDIKALEEIIGKRKKI